MGKNPAELIQASGADNNVRPVGSRRDFLKAGILAASGIIAAAAAWPLARLAMRKTPWTPPVFVDAVMLADMPEVGVKMVDLSLTKGGRPDARVFVKRTPDGSIIALSAVCSHLGCIVNYDRLKDQFVCPCHGGRYDGNGKNISGPPPAPLARLPVRIAGAYIQVGIRRPPV